MGRLCDYEYDLKVHLLFQIVKLLKARAYQNQFD